MYLLSCKICRMQKVCTTADKFRLKWNNYKDNDRKAQRGEEHMELELFEHFHSEEHNGFLQDCSITLIEKHMVQTLQDVKITGMWCLKQ